MKIVYGINIPVSVVADGKVLNGNKKVDLVTDAELLVVFPVRKTAQLQRPGAAARVQDRYTGEIITVQAFNEQAYELAGMQVGATLDAFGSISKYRGSTRFTISEFLPDAPEVFASRKEAVEASALDAAPAAMENEQVGSFHESEVNLYTEPAL